MKIGILGTGMVGQALATKLVTLGHEVTMGARNAGNEKAVAWAKHHGTKASTGTFADAANFGELNIVCTKGDGTVEAVKSAAAQLAGKTLIDVTNPLAITKGQPPTLFVSNNDSLGEHVQRAVPQAKVVKALNTVNASVMVEPMGLANGEHDLLLCGNDAGAKEEAKTLLRTFGWRHFVDLGDITQARGQEAWLLLWVRLWGAYQTPTFNLRLVR